MVTLPKAVQAFIDSRNPGHPHPAYRAWMDDVTNALNAASTSEDLAALIARLGSTDGTIAGIPDPSELQLVAGVGIAITNGGTIALRPLADSGVATTLLRVTRDVYGRVSGTAPVEPTDILNPYADYLVDGDGNYLVDADGNFIVAQNGFPIPQAYGGTGVAGGGTSAQFLRGDGVWTDTLLTGPLMLARYADNSAGFQMRFIKSRGSEESPTGLLSADTLMSFQVRGYHSGGGTPALSGNVGDIAFDAREDFTSTAQGTRCFIRTTTLGSTSLGVRLQVDSDKVAPGTTGALTLGADNLRWSATYTVDQHRSGAMFETGVISIASLGADTHNWAPTGLAGASIVRCGATGGARTVTGIVAPTSAQRVRLVNISTLDLVLAHDNASSTAANRFYCPGSASFTLNANDSVDVWYDVTSARWRVLGA